MLLVLGPHRNSCQTEQTGYRQNRHTRIEAKMHSSSYFWLGQSSLRIAPCRGKEHLGNLLLEPSAKDARHFEDSGFLCLSVITDCHSPLIMPCRIFLPLYLFWSRSIQHNHSLMQPPTPT